MGIVTAACLPELLAKAWMLEKADAQSRTVEQENVVAAETSH